MAVHGIHHVTLAVADVAATERAYCDVFDFDVLFREGTYDGEFGALPDDLDWEAATDAGVEPGMSFLRREGATVAIAEPEPDESPTVDEATTSGDQGTEAAELTGALDHVALHVDATDVPELADRARARGWTVDERDTAAFLVDDDGIEWEINASSPPPATPFDALDVERAESTETSESED